MKLYSVKKMIQRVSLTKKLLKLNSEILVGKVLTFPQEIQIFYVIFLYRNRERQL